MSFLLASLAVVALMAFVVWALDEPPPKLLDLSDLDDGGMLPSVIDARDKARDEASRLRKLLDETVRDLEGARGRADSFEAAASALPAPPSRTYVAEVSTAVVLKEADASDPDDEECGGGSSPPAVPR